MKIDNYNTKIALFYETNPHLSHEELAVVLTADLLYKELPEDLPQFRKKYAHLDPAVLTRSSEGIAFLRIAEDRKSAKVLKQKLNAYLNTKFHHIKHRKGYEANISLFKERSVIASRVIEDILLKTGFGPRKKEESQQT